MLHLHRRLSRLPNYIRRFGLWGGLRMVVRIETSLPQQSGEFDDFVVPGLQHPIRLRRSVADHATFWQCIVQNQYQFHIYPQAPRLQAAYDAMVAAGEQPLIIDGGANIGLATVWFANAFPQARIVAVEPDDANLAIFKANTRPYGDRIQVLQGGLWNKAGHVRIHNPEAGSSAFRVTDCAPDAPGAVRTYTIGAILEQLGIARPFIVKLDIEGAQTEVFRTDTDWVGETSMLVMELDDWLLPWSGSSRNFFSCVSRWPFDYLLGGESIFCFRDFGTLATSTPNGPAHL